MSESSSSRSERIIPFDVSPRRRARLEHAAVRHAQAGQGHGHRVAGGEVPGAAHDLARLALPHVDAAQLQPVGVRMRAGLDNEAGDHPLAVAVVEGQAAPGHAVDLDAGHDQSRGQLVGAGC